MIDSTLISFLKDVVINAGDIALQARKEGIVIEYKQDNSPVTSADKSISDYIYSSISLLPYNFPVICEERPLCDIDSKGSFWLIDPIDGTKSFIKNKDSFTINIALIVNKIPVLGFVYQPSLEKLYYIDHELNFCREDRNSKPTPPLAKREGFTAIVSSNHFNKETADYLKDNNFSEIIAIPSSIKLCMIAEGRGDVYPKFGNTMEWDIAAGHALINASGGKITDIDGQVLYYGKPNFANSNFLAMSKRWLDSLI